MCVCVCVRACARAHRTTVNYVRSICSTCVYVVCKSLVETFHTTVVLNEW
jgi:hypothetical protein